MSMTTMLGIESENMSDQMTGFRFLPSDEELIMCFLLRRAMDLPLPLPHPILEGDLYGEKAAPREVFKNVSDEHWDVELMRDDREVIKEVRRTIYVFTELKKVEGKSRVPRRAGDGTWKGQTGGKEIYHNRECVGVKKMLSFEPKRQPDRWIMHEYSLDGVSLNKYDVKHKDVVLCRITWISKAEGEKKNQAAGSIINSAAINEEQLISLPSYDHAENKRPASEVITIQETVQEDVAAKKARIIGTSPNITADSESTTSINGGDHGIQYMPASDENHDLSFLDSLPDVAAMDQFVTPNEPTVDDNYDLSFLDSFPDVAAVDQFGIPYEPTIDDNYDFSFFHNFPILSSSALPF